MGETHDDILQARLGKARPRRRLLAAAFLVFLLAMVPIGCAALTNPLADGIPVRNIPPELLIHPQEGQTLPLNLLGQPKPDTYRLAPGDVLGVYIDGILGDKTQALPMHVAPPVLTREQRRFAPGLGYPIVVQDDGTIVLPLVDPLPVSGMTLLDAREAIRSLYVKKKLLLREQDPARPTTDRVLVSLLQTRQYQVVVWREEAVGYTPGPDGPTSTSKSGTGYVVDLSAHENDVLHALALTGGPPGIDAFNEIVIFRNGFSDPSGRTALLEQFRASAPGHGPPEALASLGQVTRIPLKIPPGTRPPVCPEDVILRTGDVVYVPGREDDLFYTGGLLPPGAHLLPRNRSLDVIEAITQVRGPLLNGAFGGSNLSGTLISPGIGNPSPSLLVVLRRTPGGGQVPIVVDLNRALTDAQERIQVHAGDVLILQEMPGEALARYFTQTFLNFNLVWEAIHSRFVSGVFDVSAPDRLTGTRLETVPLRSR
jgi:hypothetical protein